MLGSGPMGELIAIDRLEIAAGTLVVIGMGGVLLAAMNSPPTKPNFNLAGPMLVGLSLIAAGIYTVGLAGVAGGWITPSLFPDRFVQNLMGSLLAAALGFVLPKVPRLLQRIAASRKQDV